MTGPETTLTGRQARAVAVAWAEFATTGHDPTHYQVGREIHYWISRDDFGLQRTTIAR